MSDPADISHLLRRTEFVVKPERLAALVALTIDQAVDDILDFGPNGDPQMDPYLLSEDTADGWTQYAYACNWWTERMTSAPRAFQEKMTLFWHSHFTSSWSEIHKGFQMMVQNQLYRSNALGNLEALTQAMAIDPAMLVYLSNASNVKGQPNQNFARELMELFTLGIGNYTEDDVNASARAWTGYNYDGASLAFVLNADEHDDTAGWFFGIEQPWTGPQIIEAIFAVKGLLVARFIAKALWEFLAYIGPAPDILDDLAAVLVGNQFELRPLLAALLKRSEFYSDTAKQGLVRTPIEYLVALSYHSGLTSIDLGAEWRLDSTGQAMYQPPNVAGWKPNGYWLNTSAISGRSGFADAVAWKSSGPANYVLGLSPDGPASAKIVAANTAVDLAAGMFGLTADLGRALSEVTRRPLVDWHASEPNSYFRMRNLLFMTMLSPEMNMA